jgi:hypothetical protein
MSKPEEITEFQRLQLEATREQTDAITRLAIAQEKTIALSNEAARRAHDGEVVSAEKNRLAYERSDREARERGEARPIPVTAMITIGENEVHEASFSLQCVRLMAAEIETDPRYKSGTPGEWKVNAIVWPSFSSPGADASIDARVAAFVAEQIANLNRNGQSRDADDLAAVSRGEWIANGIPGAKQIWRTEVYSPLQKRTIGRLLSSLLADGFKLAGPDASSSAAQ